MKKYCILMVACALLGGCTEQEENDVVVEKVVEKLPLNSPKPAMCNDSLLENTLSCMLQENMVERNCDKGALYVVETRTGRIKANVSLERKNTTFVPWKDVYAKEQSTMESGSTYLALLSTGRISVDDVIDTENGVYKEVRDHNWMKGGFGPITLEQALGYRSLVAFTKAKEQAFANNPAEYDNKISKYMGGQPNEAMGMLNFYNTVANGGRMVKLVSEEDCVTVLDEQIEERKYIEELQRGLSKAVSYGYYKKAGRPYTYVAACGRTFKKSGNTWRMELCGYFPADNPMYTIMVITEKDRLPASAGGICGPIMANAIDIIVEHYNLRSMIDVIEESTKSAVV